MNPEKYKIKSRLKDVFIKNIKFAKTLMNAGSDVSQPNLTHRNHASVRRLFACRKFCTLKAIITRMFSAQVVL